MENELETVKNEIIYQSGNEEIRINPAIVKKFLVRGSKQATDAEVFLFMQLCKFKKLNPFLNEAYLVKFGADAQLIVGKEAFMKRAENNVNYEGFEAGIIVERNGEIVELEGSFKLKNDILLGGWCDVNRSDRIKPFKAKVTLTEYDKKQSTWKTLTSTMIRKTAIVQALREAFPQELGGMYTKEDNQFLNQKEAEKVVNNNKKSALEKAFEIKEPVEKIEETVDEDGVIIDGDGVIIEDTEKMKELKEICAVKEFNLEEKSQERFKKTYKELNETEIEFLIEKVCELW